MSVLLKANILNYDCGEATVKLADDTVVDIFTEDVIVTEMYMITMLCFEPDGTSYIDCPEINYVFINKDDAFKHARELAEYEVEYLNEDTVDGVSFGIVEDSNSINVLYYYLESAHDTTGNTEQVTNYIISSIEIN